MAWSSVPTIDNAGGWSSRAGAHESHASAEPPAGAGHANLRDVRHRSSTGAPPRGGPRGGARGAGRAVETAAGGEQGGVNGEESAQGGGAADAARVARAKRLAATATTARARRSGIDAMTRRTSRSRRRIRARASKAEVELRASARWSSSCGRRAPSAARVMLHKRAEQGARARARRTRRRSAPSLSEGELQEPGPTDGRARGRSARDGSRSPTREPAAREAVADMTAVPTWPAEVVDLRAEMSVCREQMAALRKRVSQQNDQLERLRFQLYSERRPSSASAPPRPVALTTPKRPVMAPPTPRRRPRRRCADGDRLGGKVMAAAPAAPTAVPASRVLHEDIATRATPSSPHRRGATRSARLLPPTRRRVAAARAPPPPEAAPADRDLSPGRTAGVAAPGQLRTTFGRRRRMPRTRRRRRRRRT